MAKPAARRVQNTIKSVEKRLKKAGIGRDAHHTKRRIVRELQRLAVEKPQWAAVKKHSFQVKRTADALAKAMQEKGIKVDRGLVSKASLAHDSKRDLPEQDFAAKEFWAKKGAPSLARTIGSGSYGEPWSLKNYGSWSLEKKIYVWADNMCRAVRVGEEYVNGVVPSNICLRLVASQRKNNPEMLDSFIREMQALKKFENELKGKGINPDAIALQQMKKNPRAFMQGLKNAIDPKVGQIIAESMKRQGIKRI